MKSRKSQGSKVISKTKACSKRNKSWMLKGVSRQLGKVKILVLPKMTTLWLTNHIQAYHNLFRTKASWSLQIKTTQKSYLRRIVRANQMQSTLKSSSKNQWIKDLVLWSEMARHTQTLPHRARKIDSRTSWQVLDQQVYKWIQMWGISQSTRRIGKNLRTKWSIL